MRCDSGRTEEELHAGGVGDSYICTMGGGGGGGVKMEAGKVLRISKWGNGRNDVRELKR